MSNLFTVLLILMICLISIAARAASPQASFTPSALLIPIRRVLIADRLGGASTLNKTLYECKATRLDDCLINVLDNSILSKLMPMALKIKPGTYTGISISHCTDAEGGYTSYVRGSVNINGTAYYTTDNGQVLSTQSTDLGYVSAHVSGCQSDTYFPTPLIIGEGSATYINLFLSGKNISWAVLGAAPITEGCRENAGQTASVCSGYALVTPSIGRASPRLRTFHIYELAGHPEAAGGQVLVIQDSAGQILGGYTRRLYSVDSLGMSGNFDTACKTWSSNGDGSYRFENIGSTFSDYYMRFDAFQLADHTGTYTTRAGQTITYWAVEQP